MIGAVRSPNPIPLHVLVVDDDPVSRFAARAAVERLGHVCTVAEDGLKGLVLYEEQQPAVVVIGWRMGGLDGTALTRRIREHPSEGYTYVIVLAREGDGDVAREAMEAGADELVTKPLDVALLERQFVAAGRVIDLHGRLRADARIDPLTGIANRRGMTEELSVLVLRAARYGHELAVVLVGLDRFRAYNEAAGRTAGDEVLRRAGVTLKGSLRGSDNVYRADGDEFLALLPDQGLPRATVAAERLRRAFCELALSHPAGGQVTISGGVAALAEHEPAEGLLARAGGALQAAKLAGRDCVRWAEWSAVDPSAVDPSAIGPSAVDPFAATDPRIPAQ